jgi:hypothetical protein
VFYHDQAVPIGQQGIKGIQQLSDIMKMKPCRWFIEDEEGRLLGIALGQEYGQLDALCFSTTQGAAGLAEVKVTEAYISQGLQLASILNSVWLCVFCPPKKPSASSVVISRISVTCLPWYFTSRISSLKRFPPQVSQVSQRSAMNCISILTRPSPSHSSQRPPSTLKEKNPGL